MNSRDFAIKACETLKQHGGYVKTPDIMNLLGITGNYAAYRNILNNLEEIGVLHKYGNKIFRYKLVNPDYNTWNPLNTPKKDHGLPKEEKTKGFPSKYNSTCVRCGNTIPVGSMITGWTDAYGTKHYIHVECLPEGVKEDNTKAPKEAKWDAGKEDELELTATSESKNTGIGAKEIASLVELVSKVGTRIDLVADAVLQMNERLELVERERPPREIIIKEVGKDDIKLEGHTHPIMEKVLFHIKCGDNVMLVGPKGCGKTVLCQQVADVLGLPYGMISLSGGVTESKLFGRVVPNVNTGKQEYHRPLFVELFEEGGLFLLDEVDAGDSNMLLSLNSGFANKILAIDRPKNPIAKMNKDFIAMAAANTWGNGAERMYCGRNQQDGAFSERFHQIAMDYDRELEQQLCPGGNDLLDMLWTYRDKINKAKLERSLSTRFILRAYNWMKYGKDLDYVRDEFFAGWSKDEVNQVKGYV